ncbi:HrpA-like helicase [Vibrio ponticus]|nr:HrpA-like helicase [Vibrio ponticus]
MMMEVMLGRDSRLPNSVEAALVLDTHSIPGRGVKQTLTLATQTMPLELRMLPQIPVGQWQQGDTIADETGTFVEMQLVYAGRVIATEKQAAQGALALQPMLEAVKLGEKLAGLYLQRKQEIDHWRIYVDLGLAETTEHHDVTFDIWFNQQLELLELDDVDELDLFSAEDFPFEAFHIGNIKNLPNCIHSPCYLAISTWM